MAFIRETNQSRRIRDGEQQQREFSYIVYDVGNSEDVALAIVQASTPPELGELDQREIALEQLAFDVWQASVRYSKADDQQQQDPDIAIVSFDTGGRTEHVMEALETERYDIPGAGAAPDYGNRIEVHNGEVRGLDIVAPALRIEYTFTKHVSAVTTAYVKRLAEYTGSINSQPFKQFEAEELLFLGASGRRRDAQTFEITVSFEARATQNNLNIAGVSVDKRGHDYVWVSYVTATDSNSQLQVEKPQGVYRQRIYPKKDFANLEIP